MNHTDGQDGPDDFDRPQTIASYSSVASAVFWGVDFATTAVAQVFELIDCEYDGEMSPSRALEVERERDWAAGACKRIIASDLGRYEGLDPDLN